MTKEIIHVCSYSAQESMKYAINMRVFEGNNVIGLIDDLSNGPIAKITNMNKRIDWCKNIYFKEFKKMSEEIEDSYEKLHEDIMKI